MQAAIYARSFVGVLGLFLSALGQTVSLRPGNYETAAEISIPGSPVKQPPHKAAQCISSRDLKEFAERLTTTSKNCAASDLKLTGAKATFTRTCKDRPAITTKGEVTFSSESFIAEMESTAAGRTVMTGRVTGKRIGDCAK